MDDQLLNYYERELTFIRAMGAEFARKYPNLAGRLLLEPDKCDDPHTERLIEAFAFISGRIHKKIDDDFPEITESLLSILYPHYIRPIPAMSVVQFEPIKQNISEAGHRIANNTRLYSKPVRGNPCQFSSCQPVRLWPVEVVAAGLRDPKDPTTEAQQAIYVRLKTYNNLSFSQLEWKKLRFFLNGPHQHVFHIYELLFNNVCQVRYEAVDAQGKIDAMNIPPDSIKPVGFNADENVLPHSGRSFPGYLLLFEYFCFPEKFLFFDLTRLDLLKSKTFNDTLEIWINLNRFVKSDLVIDEDTFCLHATPVINLFRRIAEPIRIEHQKTDYRVVPDLRRQTATEIYSIDRVKATLRGSPGREMEYKPFYSNQHHLDQEDSQEGSVFWHMQRRPSGRKGDSGTDVYLSFTGSNFKPVDPGVEILTVYTTCTNRNLPRRLLFGDAAGDFDLEIEAPVERINCIIKPTHTRRPQLGGELQWRLISHLSLNYMSLVQGGEAALKEILKLYDFDNTPATRQQIEGIVSLQSRHVTKRMGQSFCRGVEVTLELDESKFVGAGLFLFGSVLERFIAQYVSVNSFSQLVVKTLQQKGILKKWPPRSGNQILL